MCVYIVILELIQLYTKINQDDSIIIPAVSSVTCHQNYRWNPQKSFAHRSHKCERKREIFFSSAYLLPLAISTRAKLQKLHSLEGEPLGDVYVVRSGSGVAAVLNFVHLPGILTLEIGNLLFNFEGVAVEDFGELLDSPFALRAVPITPGVPIPKDTPLLIFAE